MGVLLIVPGLALALSLLSRHVLGSETASLEHILRMTAIFSGVPAALTWMGLGRRAGRAAIAPRGGGLGLAIQRGALAGAVAGAGLASISAVPLRLAPLEPMPHLWIALAGGGVGLLGGAVSGLLVAWSTRRRG